jgi:hypothetical protein
MKSVSSLRAILAVAAVLTLTARVVLDAVDVHVENDKTFDFSSIRTWGWNPSGAGRVMMARTKDDDPDAMKQRVDPIVRDAVSKEMKVRGLTEAAAKPDLIVTYYLLLTINTETQTVGQFLPSTVMWGIPPFAPATSSFKVMNRGSLVIDMNAGDTIVWRGMAQAEIAPNSDAKKREARLREGVRDLLRRYPPKT